MPPSPPRDRFSGLVADWLQWLRHNRGRSPATCSKYGQYLDRLAHWCQTPPESADLRPSTSDPLTLTADDLERFAGIYSHTLGLSPRARRPLVSAVRGFYAWAAANRHLRRNPAEALPSPKYGRRMPRAASLANAERLLMAPDVSTFTGLRDAAILFALAGLGGRLSGVCGLNESSLIWADPDKGGGLFVRLREKGHHERTIPAPDELAMLLRGYLAHPELATIDRDLADGDRVLFVSVRAPRIAPHDYHGERRRITPRAVGRMLERYAAACKVPREQANPHALRHLYGAELAEDDQDLITRSALLGHVDPKETGIYSHLAARKLRAVVAKSNPLAKMRSPLLDSLRALQRQAAPSGGPRTRSGPSNA